MGLSETAVIYLAIGTGIAIAVAVRAEAGTAVRRAYLAAIALFFWPIIIPALFNVKQAAAPSTKHQEKASALTARIAEVETELTNVLNCGHDVAERALAFETEKIRSLIEAMKSQALRLDEMKRLLGTLSHNAAAQEVEWLDSASAENVNGRRRNIDLLQRLHDNTEQQLWRVVTKIEELISMIYVARFAGGQRSDIERLLNEIAATVESISTIVLDGQSPDLQTAQHRVEGQHG